MLRYLFAILLAPLLRPVIRVVAVLAVGALAVSLPARLWVHFIDPRPDRALVIALNLTTAALIALLLLARALRRRSGPGRQRRN